MIEVGIDEITIVLKVLDSQLVLLRPGDWPAQAEELINEFVNLTGLDSVFGDLRVETRCPNGYSFAFTLGTHSFYLALAFHESYPLMGICIRFSAQALSFYLENTGNEVFTLLQDAHKSSMYQLSLSRIDLTADYFNEDIDVTRLYRGISAESILVMREQLDPRSGEYKLRRTASKLSGYAVNDRVPTFYLGSRKANIDALLRVYDKRLEQIETNGVHYSRAESCESWVRFEASLRHGYAKQICDTLLLIGHSDELAMCIASVFVQRYQFHELVDGSYAPMPLTQSLINAIGSPTIRLSSPNSRNNDLLASLKYIRDGSGFLSILHKAWNIWGSEAPRAIFNWLEAEFKKSEPNKDCLYWLQNNELDYRKSYPDIDDFLSKA